MHMWWVPQRRMHWRGRRREYISNRVVVLKYKQHIRYQTYLSLEYVYDIRWYPIVQKTQTMKPLTQNTSEKGGNEKLISCRVVFYPHSMETNSNIYKQHNRYRMYLSYMIRGQDYLWTVLVHTKRRWRLWPSGTVDCGIVNGSMK